MSASDFKVPPRSWDNIERVACQVRNVFGMTDVPRFPIIDAIEKILYQQLDTVRFEVGNLAEMDGAEGLTCPKGEFIQLREDVYRAAIGGQGRARFTAAHELGHLVLHSNVRLARIGAGEIIKPFQSAEKQANRFAVELLMPAKFFSQLDDEDIVMRRHGVSREAAGNRLDGLRSKGRLPKKRT